MLLQNKNEIYLLQFFVGGEWDGAHVAVRADAREGLTFATPSIGLAIHIWLFLKIGYFAVGQYLLGVVGGVDLYI